MRKLCMGIIMISLLGLSMLYYGRTYQEVFSVFSNKGILEEQSNVMADKDGITVVVDPGHGGNDPGGIGVSGILEKNVNLAIALHLKTYLEHQGIRVVMTRETDQGLYSDTAQNKKKEDLAKRISIIEEAQPDFVLCIHQNIFTDAKYSGAQVFYYKESEEGAKLASSIQDQLIAGVDPANTRVPKSNMNYYMLKQSPVPIVIVECGFLSNVAEEAKLGTENYQRSLAWNIYLGTMHYLNAQ